MLENLTALKTELLTFSNELQKSEFIDKSLIKNSDFDRDVVNLETGVFKVALVSTFSAGKSTFINALLGVDILGMDELAFTATITRIKYMTEVYLEIIYQDGRKDIISGSYQGQEIKPSNAELIKNIIKEKTTVLGHGEELKVREVVIGYPFELCKNGVEIIDTPGLSSRHENHDQITNMILPNVHAVIFLFEPTNISAREFLEKIKTYVQEAAASKLEEKSEHIFLAMNKADTVYPVERIDGLLGEIKAILKEIIYNPSPFALSSYYALMARLYKNGFIDLRNIQRNDKIRIPDPEDPEFPITGKLIQEEHIGNIIAHSNILDVEKRLSNYLESKGNIFLDNLNRTLDSILKNNMKQLENQLKSLTEVSAEDEERHNAAIRRLIKEIEELESRGIDGIKDYINKQTIGGSLGGILPTTENAIQVEYGKIGPTTTAAIINKWDEEKYSVTTADAAYRKMEEIVSSASEWLNVYTKQFAQSIFLKIKEQLIEMIEGVDRRYMDVMKNIDAGTQKALGNSLTASADSRIKGLDSVIQEALEKEFVAVISTITRGVRGEVEQAAGEATKTVEKNNLLNKGKKLFNSWFNTSFKITTETHFDTYEFRQKVGEIIKETCCGEIEKSLLQNKHKITERVISSVEDVCNSVTLETISVVKKEIQIRKDMLEKQKISFGNAKGEREKRVSQIEDYIRKTKTTSIKLVNIAKTLSRR